VNIGRAIRTCRAHKKLTQAALASRCNLSESYLSVIESGRREPTLSTLEVIAKGLEIPLSMLVFLGAESDELSTMSPEIKEKLSSAILSLLQATTDDHQPPLI
jgi:transcriptional regulator with XRE-family HTH domain